MDRKRWRADRKNDLDEMLPKATGRYGIPQIAQITQQMAAEGDKALGSCGWLDSMPLQSCP